MRRGLFVVLVCVLWPASALANWTTCRTPCQSDSGGDATESCQVASVAAGDLIVVHANSGGTSVTLDSVSDGTSSFTGLTTIQMSNAGGQHRIFYLLSSVATGTVTYTLTASGTAYLGIQVYACAPDGGDTVSFDQENGAETIGSELGSSGNITTTGTDEIVFGAQVNENTAAVDSYAINAQSPTGSTTSTSNWQGMWYWVTTSTFTGDADLDLAAASRNLVSIAAFKAVAGAGGGRPGDLLLLGVGR